MKAVFVLFYENFIKLCTSISKSPSAVVQELGFRRSVVTNWKKRGSAPTDANLQRIADYFGITVAEVLGEEKEKTATDGDDLSAEEWEFVKLYREASEKRRAAVKLFLEE